MGTLGEGELNTVGKAELMACVVAAESTRGNVVYVTDYQILKKRHDRGLAHTAPWTRQQPRSLVAIVPCPKNEARKHLQCSGSVRMLTLPTSKMRITTWRLYLAMRWPMRWLRRQQVKRRCGVRQRNKWLGWTRWLGSSREGSLRQLASVQSQSHSFDTSRKRSQEGSIQNCLAGTF